MSKNKSYTLFVDGASRGNPGNASIGCVLIDEAGEEVFTISKTIGIRTNNQAEYSALIEGLIKAFESDIQTITVKADSELMVRQMTGQYKVKNPDLKQLWAKAQEISKEFSSFSIEHVRREGNSRADELANLALDNLS